MSTVKVVRYRTKPEQAEENVGLVQEVFAELAVQAPEGLSYMTLRLEDGVSFVHVALVDGETNPLTSLAAFQGFLSEIGARCDDGPTALDATVVGSYAFTVT